MKGSILDSADISYINSVEFVTPKNTAPKYSSIVRAAWMVDKIVYAVLLIMSFVTLAACRSLNDLLPLLVVIAILVVIGFFGAIIDKRVSSISSAFYQNFFDFLDDLQSCL